MGMKQRHARVRLEAHRILQAWALLMNESSVERT